MYVLLITVEEPIPVAFPSRFVLWEHGEHGGEMILSTHPALAIPVGHPLLLSVSEIDCGKISKYTTKT